MTASGGAAFEAVDPVSAEATQLLAAYLDEISATFGYDTTKAVPTTPEDYLPPRGRFLVVREPDGSAIGCGGIRLLDAGTAEVKRMYLRPTARGRGLGRQLLAALEAAAISLGAREAVLDTNESLESALALYRNAGWREVAAYNDNPEATHWFTKQLR